MTISLKLCLCDERKERDHKNDEPNISERTSETLLKAPRARNRLGDDNARSISSQSRSTRSVDTSAKKATTTNAQFISQKIQTMTSWASLHSHLSTHWHLSDHEIYVLGTWLTHELVNWSLQISLFVVYHFGLFERSVLVLGDFVDRRDRSICTVIYELFFFVLSKGTRSSPRKSIHRPRSSKRLC